MIHGTGLVTSFIHAYGPTKAVYHPAVTVTDAAGNSTSYQLTLTVADHHQADRQLLHLADHCMGQLDQGDA